MNTPTNRKVGEDRPGKNQASEVTDRWVAAQIAMAPPLTADRAERIASMLLTGGDR